MPTISLPRPGTGPTDPGCSSLEARGSLRSSLHCLYSARGIGSAFLCYAAVVASSPLVQGLKLKKIYSPPLHVTSSVTITTNKACPAHADNPVNLPIQLPASKVTAASSRLVESYQLTKGTNFSVFYRSATLPRGMPLLSSLFGHNPRALLSMTPQQISAQRFLPALLVPFLYVTLYNKTSLYQDATKTLDMRIKLKKTSK